MKKMGVNQRLGIGILIGGAIGSALAFLFAPKSGREFRADIKEGTGRSVEAIKNSGVKIADSTKSVAASMVSRLQSAMHAGQSVYEMEASGSAGSAKTGSVKTGSVKTGSVNAVSGSTASGSTKSAGAARPSKTPVKTAIRQSEKTPHGGVPAEGPADIEESTSGTGGENI